MQRVCLKNQLKESMKECSKSKKEQIHGYKKLPLEENSVGGGTKYCSSHRMFKKATDFSEVEKF